MARHWLAAGPAYADRAWRAAVAAAEVARRLHALRARPPSCSGRRWTPRWPTTRAPRRGERYDVLMRARSTAYRWAAHAGRSWSRPSSRRSTSAEELGDPELVAAAAIATTQGALWQSAPHGEVARAGRRARCARSLDRLPPEDGELRCRVLLGLANELYYGASLRGAAGAGRRGPGDGAPARRRRRCCCDACQIAFVVALVGRHRGGAARPRRRGGRARGRGTGNERAYVVAGTLRAVVLGELGRPPEMWAAVDVARARGRAAAAALRADGARQPGAALAGDGRPVRRVRGADRAASSGSTARSRCEQSEDAIAGALIALQHLAGAERRDRRS